MAVANSWTPKLGLDLRGGTTITLTASNTSGTGGVDPASLELARTIIQQRVDSLGVGETEVATSGERQIVVSVPNVQRDELVRMVGQTAQLFFRPVWSRDASSAPVPTVEPTASASPGAAPTDSASPSTAPSATPTESATVNRRPAPGLPTPVASPRPTVASTKQPTVDDVINWKPSDRDLADFDAYKCGDPFPDVPDQPLITCDRELTTKYLLGPAALGGNLLTQAAAGVPQNQVSWVVTLQFNSEGAAKFEQMTKALATRTTPQNEFGIVLDGHVISSPYVRAAIPGGSAEISGSFNQKSATDLANVLKYGALPLAFEVSSVDNVSAKLGGDQLQAGIIAGIIGLILVVGYSVLYYRGLSIVVVASLAIAAAITYALVVLLGQSMGFALNLPGVAGMIVAIGVTADSFIIYFERIRDEVREGRTLRTAIETGWQRSRSTILVADGVSLLSAVVLFILAIGAVKGFAFTLGLTTLIDIAVVFWFTHPMVSLLGQTKFYGEGRRFSGFEAEHMGARAPLHSGIRRRGTGEGRPDEHDRREAGGGAEAEPRAPALHR
ncbi:MAG: protein translocase subunit SecD [Micropruina sp.]|nr:MAG: protein translocase subunit SecD [Micropruina sp.]